MPSNDDRADWAQTALDAFRRKTGQTGRGEMEEALGDLLCNLMHLCERDGIDFAGRLANGRGNFEAEGGARHALDDIAMAENEHNFPLLFHVRYWDADGAQVESCELIFSDQNPRERERAIGDMDEIRRLADERFGDGSVDAKMLRATIDGPFYLRNAIESPPRLRTHAEGQTVHERATAAAMRHFGVHPKTDECSVRCLHRRDGEMT